MFPSPAGVRIVRCGITQLNFGSCAEGVLVSRGDGRCVSRQRKPQKRSPHGLGVVAVGRDGYRRDRRGGKSRGHNDGCGRSRPWISPRGGIIARRADGLGAPPGSKPYSTAGGVPAAAAVLRRVRVGMRPEGGRIVRDTGLSGGGGTDADGSMIMAESSPSKALVERGARWATVVAAAGASAEPELPAEGTTKTEAKTALTLDWKTLKPGRRPTVAAEVNTRATSFPEGAEKAFNPHTWPVCVKIAIEEVKGSPHETALSVRGTSPPKSTSGVGEERVRSPQARMRKIPSSSPGVRRLDPLRSCSVVAFGKREVKSEFLLELPLRYSTV